MIGVTRDFTTEMPTPVLYIILGFVVFDLLIALVVVRSVIVTNFGPLAKDFPDEEPDEAFRDDAAPWRRGQSFAMGLLNLGFSMAVRVDGHAVRLRPEPWVRWMGLRRLSIPRSAITPEGQRRGRLMLHPMRVVRPGGQTVTIRGPRWLWDAINPNEEVQ